MLSRQPGYADGKARDCYRIDAERIDTKVVGNGRYGYDGWGLKSRFPIKIKVDPFPDKIVGSKRNVKGGAAGEVGWIDGDDVATGGNIESDPGFAVIHIGDNPAGNGKHRNHHSPT